MEGGWTLRWVGTGRTGRIDLEDWVKSDWMGREVEGQYGRNGGTVWKVDGQVGRKVVERWLIG